MKKFEFNHAYQQWDSYKAFHCSYLPFIEFASGQLAVVRIPDPYERKLYERYNVQLVTTKDSDLPPLYLNKDDEKPIPKAWVQQGGQQHLAVDWERGVAVALGYSGYRSNYRHPDLFANTVPNTVKHAFVYWAGEERLPVSQTLITVSQPARELNQKFTELLSEVKPALAAIMRMKPKSQTRYLYGNEDKVAMRTEWLDMTVEDVVEEMSNKEYNLIRAVRNGFETFRTVQEVQYLYVKGDK